MELFRLLNYSTSYICLVCYLLIFIKWRYRAGKMFVSAVLTIVVLIGLEWIRYVNLTQGIVETWTILAQFFVFQGAALYLSQYRDFRGLFTGLTSINYMLFGNWVARSIFIGGGSLVGSMVVLVVIHVLFLAGLVRFLRPLYMEFQSVNRRDWKGLCAAPAGFYLVLGFLKSGSSDLILLLAIITLLLTMYLMYAIMFRLINSINREEQMQKERNMLETSIKAIKRAVEEAHVTEQRMAIYDHDRRHLIRTLRVLMEKKDYGAIEQILNQMQEVQTFSASSRYCDNVPINGVVTYYAEAAKRNQIQTSFSLDIPRELKVNEWELAAVIGNLMENAVNAAGAVNNTGTRMLGMTAKQVRGQLLIEIKNNYEGNVAFHTDTGLPLSSGGEGHGIGLRSVKYFAEHTGAVFDCGIEEELFTVRLLI